LQNSLSNQSEIWVLCKSSEGVASHTSANSSTTLFFAVIIISNIFLGAFSCSTASCWHTTQQKLESTIRVAKGGSQSLHAKFSALSRNRHEFIDCSFGFWT
jgi:hypothetical protein